jgi:D-arabinose 5-phosphate isomerase GutQ
VARKIAATLASTGSAAMFVHPGEASHGDLGMIGEQDVILALSKTGETRSLPTSSPTPALRHPADRHHRGAGQRAGRAADVVLRCPTRRRPTDEVNAPTTSTTLQMALGDALAVALLERRGFKPQDFRVLHPGGKLGAMLRTVGDLMHGASELPLVAPRNADAQALLVMTEKRWGIVGVTDDAGRCGRDHRRRPAPPHRRPLDRTRRRGDDAGPEEDRAAQHAGLRGPGPDERPAAGRDRAVRGRAAPVGILHVTTCAGRGDVQAAARA